MIVTERNTGNVHAVDTIGVSCFSSYYIMVRFPPLYPHLTYTQHNMSFSFRSPHDKSACNDPSRRKRRGSAGAGVGSVWASLYGDDDEGDGEFEAAMVAARTQKPPRLSTTSDAGKSGKKKGHNAASRRLSS